VHVDALLTRTAASVAKVLPTVIGRRKRSLTLAANLPCISLPHRGRPLSAHAVGIGLVYLRKWAVALFAVSTVTIGLFLIVRSIIETPFPWTLVNIGMGILFCLPTVPAIRSWKQLR
jgi:hypothetical protein